MHTCLLGWVKTQIWLKIVKLQSLTTFKRLYLRKTVKDHFVEHSISYELNKNLFSSSWKHFSDN